MAAPPQQEISCYIWNIMQGLECNDFDYQMVTMLDMTKLEAFMNFSETSPETIIEQSKVSIIRNSNYHSFIMKMYAIGIRCHEIMATQTQERGIAVRTVNFERVCTQTRTRELRDIRRRRPQQYDLRLTAAMNRYRPDPTHAPKMAQRDPPAEIIPDE